MNRLYMGPVISWTPIIGSATSFLVAGAGVWALVRLGQRKFQWAASPPVRLIALTCAAFFAVEALCALASFGGKDALIEIVENTVFLFFLPIYSRLSLSRRDDVREAVENAALIGAFAALIVSMYQVFFVGVRADGGAGNAVPFAVACLVTFSITTLATFRSKGYRRPLFGFASLAVATSIVLSGSRVLWLGILLLPLFSAAIYRRHMTWRSSKGWITGLVAVTAVFGIAVSGFVANRIMEGWEDVHAAFVDDDLSGSFGQRLIIWKIGWQLFLDAPFLGVGPSNAQALLAQKSMELAGVPLSFTHYHNVFLNYAVRDGILGIAAIAGLFIIPVLLATRHGRDEKGNYGLCFIVSIEITYLLSGALGIAFGHDILDSVFIISIIYGSFLVFNEPSESAVDQSRIDMLDKRHDGGGP